MPQRPSPDMRPAHHGDPLAEALRVDDVVRPRAEFKDSLRAELVSRPPVTAAPPTRVPSRLIWLAVAAVLLVALLGVATLGDWMGGAPTDPSRNGAQGDRWAAGGVESPDATARSDPGASTNKDELVTATVATGAERKTDATDLPTVESSAPVVGVASATIVPASSPTWPPTSAPVVVPAKATDTDDKPATDVPTVAATATSDDLPPGTPRPTSTPSDPDPTATPTDAGYPELPAPPTAAPTSVGLPTSIVPATPGTSSRSQQSSLDEALGRGDISRPDARCCRLGLAP